ncbi:MAG TPA: hypothetical protein VMT93_01570 [Gemmatimonadaceae bacterium]|nr:hypothetical protein [Gemmatimonadaceae bacterium]
MFDSFIEKALTKLWEEHWPGGGGRKARPPAEVGLGGERLIRADAGRIAVSWSSALVATALGLAWFAVEKSRSAAALGFFVPFLAAALALRGAQLILFAVRFRLVLTPQGLRYRRWWGRRFETLAWDGIAKIYRRKDGALVIAPREGFRFTVPAEVRGRAELLEALAEHVPRERWDATFAKEWTALERARLEERMGSLAPPKASPRAPAGGRFQR